ncbi:unnamed protein product [Kuraishia capsulata CBS 1993]|uniref:Glutamate decarboxylase n=1 Tax=Kuraishia capsulata CBS 1993 TaxID=1382522 RepID=W6MHI9_9ASCO|nr:uncharacterized protein KUCA_T00001699001 [Kuraishia capsulata CBS 1993]CDK25729.1 unnamed protein product [Kuraishia capsulata CBS 1993]
MTLSTHIDPDVLEDSVIARIEKKHQLVSKFVSEKAKQVNEHSTKRSQGLLSSYRIADATTRSKYKVLDEPMDAQSTYQSIHDDLTLDGRPTLNLASFVNTFVDDRARKLIMENLTKNLADNDEYPVLLEIHQRCISMLADLWHAPVGKKLGGEDSELKAALGTATTGSSEAIMLGGLAMKKRWQANRRAAGKDISNPNILMASCAQVALEKFARYFDVEARIIPVSDDDYLLDLTKIKQNCDENTIGIYVIVGSTFTGGFENVKKVNEILDEVERDTGVSIPIHVDGASGGFVAPFLYPELEWDFRVPRVCSINTSGHKFGLVSAGLGWLVFRDQTFLPSELKFELMYLGSVEESFTLNFSRPGFQVIHQYYNFLSLGKAGFYTIFDASLINARVLSYFLEESGYFRCISNLHLPVGVSVNSAGAKTSIDDVASLSDHAAFNPALPVVSFQFTEEFSAKYPEIPQSIIATLCRARGWIIPNYPLPTQTHPPAKGTNNEILRIVVRYNLTLQLLDKLMHDIIEITELLVDSVDVVRTNIRKGIARVEGNHEHARELEIQDVAVYNTLLSLATDGNEKLMHLRSLRDEDGEFVKHSRGKSQAGHKHSHHSFRGAC